MPVTKARTRKPKYFNRELSWIEFNRRVLNMALRTDLPLLERLRFLSIVSSNFDEFFMVRVAALRRQVQGGDYVICPSGMSPSRQLAEIRRQVKSMIDAQYRCLLKDLLPALAEQGIVIHIAGSFSAVQHAFLGRYFQDEVFPLLTPVRLNRSERNPNFGADSKAFSDRKNRYDNKKKPRGEGFEKKGGKGGKKGGKGHDDDDSGW